MKLRLKLSFLALLLGAVLFVACDRNRGRKPYYPDPNEVKTSPTSVILDGINGEAELKIISTAPWILNKKPGTEWLTVMPMQGYGNATVKITAKDYKGEDPYRTVILYIQAEEASTRVTVTQNRAEEVEE